MRPSFKDRLKQIKWEAIFVEEGHLSIGRLMAWFLLGLLTYMWVNGVIVPDSLFHIFILVLSYNFGKKLTGPLATLIDKSVDKSVEKKIKAGVLENPTPSNENKRYDGK